MPAPNRVIHDGREVSLEVGFEPGTTVEVDLRAEFHKVTTAPAWPLKPIRPQ